MWMALSGRIVLMSISSVSATGVGQHALLAQDHFFDFGVVGQHREHGLGVLEPASAMVVTVVPPAAMRRWPASGRRT